MGLKQAITAIAFGAIYASSAQALIQCDDSPKTDLNSFKSRVIVLAEIHGTKQMPAYAADLACEFTKAGKQVIVGIEVPTDRQEHITAYLDTDGEAAASAKLIASDFGKLRDGRSSHAMFDLVDAMRRLRKEGARVAVLAFDRSVSNLPVPLYTDEVLWTGERDMAMARNVESRVRTDKDAVFIILTGTVHANKSIGAIWDPNFESMTYLLNARIPVHVVAFANLGGEHWGCRKPPTPSAPLPCQVNTIKKHEAEDDPDVDSWVQLGVLTASHPLRE